MRHRKTMLKEERKGSLFKCITNRGYIFLTGGVSFILKGMLTCLPFCFTGGVVSIYFVQKCSRERVYIVFTNMGKNSQKTKH